VNPYLIAESNRDQIFNYLFCYSLVNMFDNCYKLMILWMYIMYHPYTAFLIHIYQSINNEESRMDTNLFVPQYLYVLFWMVLDHSCLQSPLK